jgi:cold shock CspA family protein
VESGGLIVFGTITKIVDGRGFGFIKERGSSNTNDLFFHFTELRGGLVFGEHLIQLNVQYDVKETFKGPQAVEVRPLD